MMRRTLALLAMLLGATVAMAVAPAAWSQTSGGPVVLMGIDAENGGPNGHGPPATYTNLVNNILAQTTKVAPEVVIVGCKPGTSTGTFWATVFPAHRCVAGGPAILAETFATAKLVIVVSDELHTPFGGLTCRDEDQALDDPSTQAEIAAHVNAGGGLLGLSSACPRPYQYIAGLAQIGVGPSDYWDIDPTNDGLATGVNDTLDVCCWHQVFTSFPSFLKVLAFEHGTANAAAIGGRDVVLPPPLVPTRLELTPDRSENPVGTTATFNAIVYDQFDRPMQGVPVTFVVAGVSGELSERDTTDRDGVATLQYPGPVATPGTDTITACVEVEPEDAGCEPEDQPRDLPSVKTWVLPVSTPNCAVDLNKETGGGQIVARNGDRFSFGGNAKVGPDGAAAGQQEAQDHGPVERFTYHGDVLAVLCFAASTTTGEPARATIFTVSKTTGSITGFARIDVTDQGEGKRTPDTYRFRLENYDTGEQQLKSGNIQIHRT